MNNFYRLFATTWAMMAFAACGMDPSSYFQAPDASELVPSFARICTAREDTTVVQVHPLADQGEQGGRQNDGIFEVVAADGRTFIVKIGRGDEFFSSQKLHRLLLEKGPIPEQVRFAYPRYMQLLKFVPEKKARETEGDVLNLVDVDVNPHDFSRRSVLLFMDKAGGLPGSRVLTRINEYDVATQQRISQGLAAAANFAHGFIVPDDIDKPDNFIIDPETGAMTYIDMDRLWFFRPEDGRYHRIYEEDPAWLGDKEGRAFQWYFHCVLEASINLRFRLAFLEYLTPEILPQAKKHCLITSENKIPYDVKPRQLLHSRLREKTCELFRNTKQEVAHWGGSEQIGAVTLMKDGDIRSTDRRAVLIAIQECAQRTTRQMEDHREALLHMGLKCVTAHYWSE
ncbi:MAG: hypothetical protein LBJ70_02245 [Holosporales bacterium]|jgi:hypothetical protein|nr:hypothetical protein [Holosporales bacterium]